MTGAYIAALKAALEHAPAHYGYTFAVWTRERLRDHLAQQTGIRISINWIGELLKQHGYVLRRPKHELRHRQDPVARAKAEETLETLKKNAYTDDFKLFFMDETTLSLHPPLRACWTQRGQQPRVPAPGVQETHHIFAAYNWCDDTVTWTTSQKKNSQAFIAFLEHLFVQRFPTQRCVLVLENAPYHTSGESLAALSLFEQRVLIVWLPKYCSLELNPIERFWRHLKDNICVNKLLPSLQGLIHAADAQLHRQNDFANPERFAIVKE